uniref:Ion transport domain-containing protein n=1 Tax=Romanomermis culicivorax TaxID=13658 RepID=A0A915KJ71_ROMCU
MADEGKLHYPLNVCGPLFEEELEFWGLDSNQVEPCCWMTYTQHRNTKETLTVIASLDDRILTDQERAAMFGWEEDYLTGNLSWWKKWKPKMYVLFDQPWSSKAARNLSFISICFIVVSTFIFCVKSQPTFKIPNLVNMTSKMIIPDSMGYEWHSHILNGIDKAESTIDLRLNYIDMACNLWFTFEIIARFIFCPNKMSFLRNFQNVVDFMATLSVYLEVLGIMYPDLVDFVQIFSIVRVLRLFRLAKHSSGLKILMLTVKASAHELVLLVFVVLLAIVLFGALIFYAERSQQNPENNFDSITHGLWWAIVTMCTIGYGDMVPKTTAGMVIGCVCALTGVLTLALPMPVIVSNFEMFYSHQQARAKLPKEKRQVLAPEQTKMILMKPSKKMPKNMNDD